MEQLTISGHFHLNYQRVSNLNLHLRSSSNAWQTTCTPSGHIAHPMLSPQGILPFTLNLPFFRHALIEQVPLVKNGQKVCKEIRRFCRDDPIQEGSIVHEISFERGNGILVFHPKMRGKQQQHPQEMEEKRKQPTPPIHILSNPQNSHKTTERRAGERKAELQFLRSMILNLNGPQALTSPPRIGKSAIKVAVRLPTKSPSASSP